MDQIVEKNCLCALNRIFGFAPKAGLALLSHFGSAAEVLGQKRTELEALLGPYSKHIGKLNPRAADEAGEELLKLRQQHIDFVGYTEYGYPPLLRECEDAPIGLYIRSTTPAAELWLPERNVAVIGTRDITPYGREWCEKIIAGLSGAQPKPLITSGLALGVDICAHQAAMECGLPTIAVMATGPESVYPFRHQGTAEKMCFTPGCALITDYPPGTAPLAIHFLRRNRIIAGISDSTILIESKIKGGGMMTSRLAFSYDREVYALTGRIDDIRSQGCNELIRRKIAEPVTSIAGLLESMRMKKAAKYPGKGIQQVVAELPAVLSGEEEPKRIMTVLKMIEKNRGITLDEIACRSGLDYRQVSAVTVMLESEGVITTDLLQRCCLNSKKFQ